MRVMLRNSLFFKLIGAFLFVIAVGGLVISVIVSQATHSAFSLYTTRSSQVWAQRLAPDLADYYAQANTWQGVEAVLQSTLSTSAIGLGQGQGQGQGRGYGARWQAAYGVMAGTGMRLILADPNGLVIGDTQNKLVGQHLAASELKNGVAISVNGGVVGTLIVTPNDLTNANTPAGQFLASVNQAIIGSAVIAAIIALILGGILAFQITSPLRRLEKAAVAIGSGDLTQRVNIPSRDEFGKLGETFNGMAESLANAENQRQAMVADVAHELRTPLAAIQATLEGVQDGILPMNDEQVNALYSETMLLNRLVGDLKLLSLADAGQLRLEKQAVEPAAFIQQIVDRARPQAEQKHIHLETNLQPGLPPVWIDGDRIAQVLNNLIGNALRYTPEGGRITIRGSHLKLANRIEISVEDTGSGIDPADLPSIFERFYRADKSRTRASGGSGLGLAIVKQLVEAHDGSVRAESPIARDDHRQGYGARLVFTLPIHPKA